MSLRPKTIVGILLTVFGLLLALAEFGIYWHAHFTGRGHYDVNPWIMFTAPIIAFVGGVLIDFAKAKETVNVIVTSGVTIMGAIPLPWGKRWTDKVAARASGAHPVPKPTATTGPDPVVTEEHDGP